MQFLAREDWTEGKVKDWVARHGWHAWRRVDHGWMVFQQEIDLRTWEGQK
jgi:hypothetical protein